MKYDKPCILIYNPISGHGHLDSWNAMFVALLLENGWRVLALTPDVPALMSRLMERAIADHNNLQILDWDAPVSGFSRQALRLRLKQAWLRWDKFGDKYYYHRDGSEVSPDMSLLESFKTRMCQLVVPLLFKTSHFFYARYRRYKEGKDEKSSSLESDLLSPAEFALRVRGGVKRAKWNPSLVFNMYMDMYRTESESWKAFSDNNKHNWAGIRFVPSETPREAYYTINTFKGMCFLDENICQIYKEGLPDKYFSYLPDITNTSLPETQSELVRDIRQRANGRNIVFLGGSIGGQKNLARWYELINISDQKKWYFVQVGEIHRGTLTKEDLVALEKIEANIPENLFIKSEYLPDERLFNEVILASDILFAVYRDFRISSNMLIKAASFKKPILVSDRFLMGERVSQYEIGLAVSENDANTIYDGLNRIVQSPVRAEKYINFIKSFNENSLMACFEEFVVKCVGCK